MNIFNLFSRNTPFRYSGIIKEINEQIIQNRSNENYGVSHKNDIYLSLNKIKIKLTRDDYILSEVDVISLKHHLSEQRFEKIEYLTHQKTTPLEIK